MAVTQGNDKSETPTNIKNGALRVLSHFVLTL